MSLIKGGTIGSFM